MIFFSGFSGSNPENWPGNPKTFRDLGFLKFGVSLHTGCKSLTGGQWSRVKTEKSQCHGWVTHRGYIPLQSVWGIFFEKLYSLFTYSLNVLLCHQNYHQKASMLETIFEVLPNYEKRTSKRLQLMVKILQVKKFVKRIVKNVFKKVHKRFFKNFVKKYSQKTCQTNY